MIRKATLISILLIPSVFSGKAQFQKGDFSVGLSSNAVMFPDYGTKIGFGLTMQVFLDKNVSLNSNLHFGPNYVHMPIGVALAGLVFLSGDPSGCSNVSCNDDDYWGVVLLILFSEGISIHVPIMNKLTFSPYVNPLGVDYWYQPTAAADKPAFLFTLSAGMKMDIFAAENFNIAPYFEYKTIYGQSNSGFGAGITLNAVVR